MLDRWKADRITIWLSYPEQERFRKEILITGVEFLDNGTQLKLSILMPKALETLQEIINCQKIKIKYVDCGNCYSPTVGEVIAEMSNIIIIRSGFDKFTDSLYLNVVLKGKWQWITET